MWPAYNPMVFSGHLRPSHLKKFPPLLVCVPKRELPTTGVSCTATTCCFSKACHSALTSTFKSPVLIPFSSIYNKNNLLFQYKMSSHLNSKELRVVEEEFLSLLKWVLSDTSSHETRDSQQPAHPLLLCNCYWAAAVFQLKNMSMLPEGVLDSS